MRIISMILIAVIIAGCASPRRLIKNQQYDLAIEKLSNKLRTGTPKEKHIQLLSQAYHTANQLDGDRINLLKQRGQADIWVEVYHRYAKMNSRQELMKGLPLPVQQQMQYRQIDYGLEMGEALSKASDYLYTRSNRLLESDDRADARQAYELLFALKQINPNYRDANALLRQALTQGTNQVLLAFDNQSGSRLPEGFEEVLMSFNPADFRDEFVQFDLHALTGKTYDFTIWITLRSIMVSPEQFTSRSFTETKEIQDGTKARRDENGNIMLDEDGNVIEVPHYITVSAEVHETLMSKEAVLEGTVDFERTSDKRILYSMPIGGNHGFSHVYASVNGDLKAISRETRKMMNNKPMPFPPDGLMLLEAAKALNQAAKRNINREVNILRE